MPKRINVAAESTLAGEATTFDKAKEAAAPPPSSPSNSVENEIMDILEDNCSKNNEVVVLMDEGGEKEDALSKKKEAEEEGEEGDNKLESGQEVNDSEEATDENDDAEGDPVTNKQENATIPKKSLEEELNAPIVHQANQTKKRGRGRPKKEDAIPKDYGRRDPRPIRNAAKSKKKKKNAILSNDLPIIHGAAKMKNSVGLEDVQNNDDKALDKVNELASKTAKAADNVTEMIAVDSEEEEDNNNETAVVKPLHPQIIPPKHASVVSSRGRRNRAWKKVGQALREELAGVMVDSLEEDNSTKGNDDDDEDEDAAEEEEPPMKKKNKRVVVKDGELQPKVVVSLKLPPPPDKIGLVLQDDTNGLPLLMALSPESPFHKAIPPYLVQKYWVIAIRDEELGEAKIRNSKTLLEELQKRRKMDQSTLVEITFGKKIVDGTLHHKSKWQQNVDQLLQQQQQQQQQCPPGVYNNNMMTPQDQQLMQHFQQFSMQMAQQQALLQQQQYPQEQQLMMQQYNMTQQHPQQQLHQHQHRTRPLLSQNQPPPAQKQTTPSNNRRQPPTITSTMSKDEMIRKALTEYFTEGESRPLKQFCDEYSKLYTDIVNELNSHVGLCTIYERRDGRKIQEIKRNGGGRRKVDEGFTREESVAALDHINSIFSSGYTNNKKRKNGSGGGDSDEATHKKKGFMPPLESTVPRDWIQQSELAGESTKRKKQHSGLSHPPCKGVYEGNFGVALSLAARCMLNTAHTLLKMAMEPDAGASSFANSYLATSPHMFLPYYGMKMERAPAPEDGFLFHRSDCLGGGGGGSGGDDAAAAGNNKCCKNCSQAKRKCRAYAKRAHCPNPQRANKHTSIETIANDPVLAKIEIEMMREEIKRLKKEKAEMMALSCEEKKEQEIQPASLLQVDKDGNIDC